MAEFPSLKTPAIIAFKGLPATLKSEFASRIAKWAKSPLLWIEDFLAPDADGIGDSASPSNDEAQQLLCQAFDALCTVAERQTRNSRVKCVVIKSRLRTTFELDRLIDLMIRCESYALLIFECQCSDEYARKIHFNQDYPKDKHWYKPKTWNEVEMATDEYDTQAWNLHFENSITTLPDDKRCNVRRLVVDIATDAPSPGSGEKGEIGGDFSWVIIDLLSKEIMVQLPNTVAYKDARRALFERFASAPRQKTNYICAGEYKCMFTYREALEAGCWVCEKPISGSGYECCSCNLVLHKSCAEEPSMINRPGATPYLDPCDETVISSHFENPYYHFTEKYVCDHCKESKKAFSYECRSCLLYTHLKCRLMPTVVNHDCHPEHSLCILLEFRSETSPNQISFRCGGCRYLGYSNSPTYMCYFCGYCYHVRCLAAPREVKHKHGGYEHVMQLKYSFDGMEEQESFWCDICHEDMDSTIWFYRCKECPYYISHMDYPSRLPCKNTGL